MRPQFHFTPERNWINDPNGLVYFEGEYHLFYQYNPHGDTWGHMHWGHAVSRDLIRWEHLPIALNEENNTMIYSGSAVVDWKNTSGFGIGGRPPLVAIYTAHYTDRPLQNQHLAFSNDRGRTWTKFSGNPVLDIGDPDFRDPKVFWHEPASRWIMVVTLAVKRRLSIYSSADLKTWKHESDFGPAGSTEGIWECPDLFPLNVDGDAARTKWVMLLNVNPGAPAGGSGCQYFVGEFDGARFVAENDEALWMDYGPDFYAAVTWSDIPASDGRRLAIGWMNNWNYGNKIPTSPWRGAMSVPRELSLGTTSGGLRLLQAPVRELRAFAAREVVAAQGDFAQVAEALDGAGALAPSFEVELRFADVAPNSTFTIETRSGPGEWTRLVCPVARGAIFLDRSRSGPVHFDPRFSLLHEAPLRIENGALILHLLVDATSMEAFAQNGETVMTAQQFPTSFSRQVSLRLTGAPPKVCSAIVREIRVPAER